MSINSVNCVVNSVTKCIMYLVMYFPLPLVTMIEQSMDQTNSADEDSRIKVAKEYFVCLCCFEVRPLYVFAYTTLTYTRPW